MDKQVISKQRVVDHGEVLTGKREVNAMLDLVKQEIERIDSRFLEPACGTGNFLTEILTGSRKTAWEEFYRIRDCEGVLQPGRSAHPENPRCLLLYKKRGKSSKIVIDRIGRRGVFW